MRGDDALLTLPPGTKRHRVHEAANFGKHSEASESSADGRHGSRWPFSSPGLTARFLSYHLLSQYDDFVGIDLTESNDGQTRLPQLERP